MSKVLVNESSLTDIADAIREKNGTEETYKPSEMGDAVRAIQSGGGSDKLWDFNITLTSDTATTKEFCDACSPYLSSLVANEDIAFVTLLNSNIEPSTSNGGTIPFALMWKKTNGGVSGSVFRYRSVASFSATSIGDSQAVAKSGDIYYVKVVKVLV